MLTIIEDPSVSFLVFKLFPINFHIWSEAPIVMRFLTFPFLEGSRAIVGSRQLQAISRVIWGLIGATRISCSVKHEPLVRDKKVGQILRTLTLDSSRASLRRLQ